GTSSCLRSRAPCSHGTGAWHRASATAPTPRSCRHVTGSARRARSAARRCASPSSTSAPDRRREGPRFGGAPPSGPAAVEQALLEDPAVARPVPPAGVLELDELRHVRIARRLPPLLNCGGP